MYIHVQYICIIAPFCMFTQDWKGDLPYVQYIHMKIIILILTTDYYRRLVILFSLINMHAEFSKLYSVVLYVHTYEYALVPHNQPGLELSMIIPLMRRLSFASFIFFSNLPSDSEKYMYKRISI